MRYGTARAAGLILGFAADTIFGDPRRGHPVALFGSVAQALESAWYRDGRGRGIGYTAVLVGGVTVAGAVVEAAVRPGGRRSGTGGLGTIAVTAAATWTALGGTSLARTGRSMADRLDSGDMSGARAVLPALCGRDPEVLDADGLARAALESIAENTSDATVAPLVWGAIAGVPGILGYRAANTLDAMVGYRSARYREFGWAAARTDDAVNLLPARVSGLLTAVLAPVIGGRPADALRAWHRDARSHPSPNAGVAEATMAGALGVTLGGRTEYGHGVEMRPELGTGPAPVVADLRRAVYLSEAVQAGAAGLAAAVAFGRGIRRR
ncbi:cobalamin biosynthesis protein [Nocardia sp. NPDC052254]|uniref:cobalamin biosynthesis protein n=1 Tax=Nocardia sp. NPDC052254 TaxID=3155681 RepID=UPI0034401831